MSDRVYSYKMTPQIEDLEAPLGTANIRFHQYGDRIQWTKYKLPRRPLG